MHLHVSLWREDEPAFAPDDGAENALMRTAVGGILTHLPGIVSSFAPATFPGAQTTALLRSAR
jgi:glutamine synthetase